MNPKAVLLIVLTILAPRAFAARGLPNCRVLLSTVESAVATRLRPGLPLDLTFRDGQGLELTKAYAFERLRVTDGKIKLRLRDDAGVTQVVGTLDDVEINGLQIAVRLRVHRRSGSAAGLGLGSDLRVVFRP